MPFDLHAGLSECRDLLLRFGGHKAAAGVTIEASRVDAFAQRFNEVARARLTPEDLYPELRIDAEISIDEVTDELEALLRHFEPFGVGNPSPVFASRNVRLAVPARVVGRTTADGALTLPGGDPISLAELRRAHEAWLPRYMAE